jgi:DNA-directed RNA polymerase specialized sigma24 family protein
MSSHLTDPADLSAGRFASVADSPTSRDLPLEKLAALALKSCDRTWRDLETRAEAVDRGRVVEYPAVNPHPVPESQFASDEARQRLLGAVEAFPEPDRRCPFLWAEGLRYREMAETLDISPSEVFLSLARSLTLLVHCADRCSL